MGVKFPYREWLSGIDVSDTDCVMASVRKLIADETYEDRQKLVALGLLLESNKERYISKLKSIIGSHLTEIERLRNENKQLKNGAETHKKIVVVRHKK